MELAQAAARLLEFESGNLRNRLWSLENDFTGLARADVAARCAAEGLDPELLRAASAIKRMASQINVVIHAVGMLSALPLVLEDDEVIEDLSLGAGNTGRPFDVETDRRVAEFKFINWRGGAEAIRQNSLFKDFFYLAEHATEKRRCIFLLDTSIPLRFLQGRRALGSVMSRNAKLAEDFTALYGDRFKVVRDYYEFRRDRVELIDLLPVLPAIGALDEGDV